MHKIIYSTKNYYLTQREFDFAVELWGKKRGYHCKRTDEMLSPFNRTEKLPDSVVYFEGKPNKFLEFRKNGGSYSIVDYEKGISKSYNFSKEEIKKFEAKLLTEDQWLDSIFDGKKYELVKPKTK